VTFRYAAFGLNFRSDIELPYLAVAGEDAAADVIIERAAVPPLDMGGERRVQHWLAAPGHFQIDIEGVARIAVAGGDRIRVDPAPGATRRGLTSQIQGSGFAALMQQRGIVPLHAGAIETPHGAVLIAGASGIGKSTTVSALAERGFRMMADDVSAISIADDGAPLLAPSYPAARLWQDSVRRLGADPETLDPVREDLAKYYLPIAHFRAEPLPVHAMIVLDSHNRPDTEITELTSGEKLDALLRYSFRRRFLAGQGLSASHFKAITHIARTVRISRVVRPALPFDPLGLADRIIGALALEPAAEAGAAA
jgi:hypothetical protein